MEVVDVARAPRHNIRRRVRQRPALYEQPLRIRMYDSNRFLFKLWVIIASALWIIYVLMAVSMSTIPESDLRPEILMIVVIGVFAACFTMQVFLMLIELAPHEYDLLSQIVWMKELISAPAWIAILPLTIIFEQRFGGEVLVHVKILLWSCCIIITIAAIFLLVMLVISIILMIREIISLMRYDKTTATLKRIRECYSFLRKAGRQPTSLKKCIEAYVEYNKLSSTEFRMIDSVMLFEFFATRHQKAKTMLIKHINGRSACLKNEGNSSSQIKNSAPPLSEEDPEEGEENEAAPEEPDQDPVNLNDSSVEAQTNQLEKEAANNCHLCKQAFEPADKVIQLPICYHIFHTSCMQSSLVASTACPLCQKSIKSALLDKLSSLIK